MTNKLKVSTTLTEENYYQDEAYLSSSRLAQFVTYDRFGKPSYNFSMFESPNKIDNKAVKIGSLVDAIITEDKFLDELVSQKMGKDELIAKCDELGIEYERTKTGTPATKNTMATYKQLLIDNGYKFGEEVTSEIYNTVEYIVSRANEVQYDSSTSFMQYVAECEPGQIILTDDENFVKGKLDLLNTKRKRYTDLKTTGNIDTVLLKELIFDGYINPYHKYVRQMAIYQELIRQATGETYEMELAIFDYKGKFKLIRIAQEALDFAANLNLTAMEELLKYVTGEKKDYAETFGINPNISTIGNLSNGLEGLEGEEDEDEFEI